MKRYHIDNLIVEITRRCNMSCAHCLRGGAQRTDIEPQYINQFLKNVESIYTLTITGGEPSLNVEGIRHLLIQLKKQNIPVESFYIVTNGSRSSMSQKFIDICIDLYKYQERKCSDGDFYPMLQMSDDEYHNQELHREVIEALDVYKFFSVRNNNYSRQNLLKEGRSRTGRELTVYPLSVEDYGSIQGEVYLNALGYITSGCDMSYVRQKREKLCHCSEFFSYMETLKEVEEV